MRRQTNKKKVILAVVKSPIAVAFVTALLTSIIAPYLVRLRKESVAEAQREKEKQDVIMRTQFEIVEKLNTIAWNYYFSAQFISLDLDVKDVNENLLDKHLKEYDSVAEITFKDFPVQAYKVRMYFDDPVLYEELMNMIKIMTRTDARIYGQIRTRKQKAVNLTEAAYKEIQSGLETFRLELEAVLDKLYKRIGKTK